MWLEGRPLHVKTHYPDDWDETIEEQIRKREFECGDESHVARKVLMLQVSMPTESELEWQLERES